MKSVIYSGNLGEEKEVVKSRFPLAKVKNIMKMDENIKLCQKNAYIVVAKATELFLQELAQNSYNVTLSNKRKTMNIEDICILFLDNSCNFEEN